MTFARVLIGFAVCALGVAASPERADAYDRPPLLEQVATVFAKTHVEVRCPSPDEWELDEVAQGNDDVLGYTPTDGDWIVLRPDLCTAASAVSDESIPGWTRAVGVLTLVHEAYHVRRWWGRRDEGRVACQAIRQFKLGARLLGASPAAAEFLFPYALAMHHLVMNANPFYAFPRCQLPLWSPPLPR